MDQNVSNLAVRTYLDDKLLPLLLQGLIELADKK